MGQSAASLANSAAGAMGRRRPARPHVVIVGGGFAGLYAARALRRAPVELTVIDRTNHHVFQPLLYQVATATLASTDVTAPIRWLLRKQTNTTVLLATVTSVEPDRRVVCLDADPFEVPYDFLVLATGSRHSYFGHDDWEPLAPGLKSIDDALEIRRRFLLAFEYAERTTDPAERDAFQTFVIVGGGPTGVELAGIIPEVARRALADEFRRTDTTRARVILLEAGPRILAAFPEELAQRAARDLAELGVEVRTGAAVTRVDADAVYVGDERIATRSVFWAAGNAASPLGAALGVPTDRAGRVPVEPDLSVPGHPEIFVAGDLALLTQDGKPVPAVAPAAMQQGTAAARNVLRTLRRQPRAPFRYRDKGNLATIGRHRAIADFGSFRVVGRLAWWFWLLVHIMYLAGFRNRLSVLLEWAYAYFSDERGARLITGVDRRAETAAKAVPPADAAPAATTRAAGAPTAT